MGRKHICIRRSFAVGPHHRPNGSKNETEMFTGGKCSRGLTFGIEITFLMFLGGVIHLQPKGLVVCDSYMVKNLNNHSFLRTVARRLWGCRAESLDLVVCPLFWTVFHQSEFSFHQSEFSSTQSRLCPGDLKHLLGPFSGSICGSLKDYSQGNLGGNAPRLSKTLVNYKSSADGKHIPALLAVKRTIQGFQQSKLRNFLSIQDNASPVQVRKAVFILSVSNSSGSCVLPEGTGSCSTAG